MYNVLVTNTYKRLKDWLNAKGGAVTDVTLDYLNRGTKRICGERSWDMLEKVAALTVTESVATLPTDCDEIIAVFTDSAGDGKAEGFLYQEGRAASGYRVSNVFVQASGWTRTITFFSSPDATVYLRYKIRTTDFTSNYAAEYTLFPELLLLKAAQLERCEDRAIDALEVQTIQRAYDKALKRCILEHEDANVDMRNEVKDEQGDRLILEEYSPDGTVQYTANDNFKDRSTLP